jgi:hypothetical protein
MKHSRLALFILVGAGLSNGMLTACSGDDDDAPGGAGKATAGTAGTSHAGSGGSATAGSGGKASAGSSNGGSAGKGVVMQGGAGGAPEGGQTSAGAAGEGGAAGETNGGAPFGGEGGEGGDTSSAICGPGLAAGKPTVPAEIAVTDAAVLVAAYAATGTQTYTCGVTGVGDAAVYAWSTASVPAATLYGTDCLVAGTHYAGPRWKANDDSIILGVVKRTTASVTAASIKRVLLATTSDGGAGILAPVTAVQRLDTVGGIAPATGCDLAHVNETVAVPYTANYYFYSGADTIPTL